MEISANYIEKFRPVAVSKSGQPRSNREDLIAKFLTRLNEDCEKDGYPLYTTGRLVRMFKGRSDSELYGLYQSCERAARFGALLNHLIKPKP